MKKYLQKIARYILRYELNNTQEILRSSSQSLEDSGKKILILTHEKEKLEKKLKRYDRPENILLSYYRIDNIGSNGMPPSYLKPNDPNDYTQRISELESVYRNTAFREMMAWALNFHANISVSGKIKNQMGDEIDISSEHARYMIDGIKAIWELVTAAHFKDREITLKKQGGNFEIEGEDVV